MLTFKTQSGIEFCKKFGNPELAQESLTLALVRLFPLMLASDTKRISEAEVILMLTGALAALMSKLPQDDTVLEDVQKMLHEIYHEVLIHFAQGENQ